jgi:hypothetical protein
MGASFMPAYQASTWQDSLTLDGSTAHAGTHSLMVKPTGSDGYSYRVLAVSAPAPSFWVRLWLKSDVDFGQEQHTAFFGASTADGDQNNGELMEVAEQYCQVVMNHKDDVVTSIGGTTACGSGGVLLQAHLPDVRLRLRRVPRAFTHPVVRRRGRRSRSPRLSLKLQLSR